MMQQHQHRLDQAARPFPAVNQVDALCAVHRRQQPSDVAAAAVAAESQDQLLKLLLAKVRCTEMWAGCVLELSEPPVVHTQSRTHTLRLTRSLLQPALGDPHRALSTTGEQTVG